MLLNARKIVNTNNNEHLILLAIEDITERRTLEDKLKKSADYLKAILETSPQITFTATAGGLVTYINKFFLDYSGIGYQEAIGAGWQATLHPDKSKDVVRSWMHSVATGEDFYKEFQLKRHDGEYRWHLTRALAIRNEEGTIVSWIGTTTDIHDQKTFLVELERKVQQRTQLLKESNIELEHSNKNLEQFAFIASHDLQEPLRKIKTYSNMLSDKFSGQLADDGKAMLDKIHSSADRMSDLIKDVLNFSRIENSENLFVETDINDILHQVLVDFNLLIAEKKAVINIGKLPIIEAIPLLINQLFYNLISNSLKFMRAGVSPVVTITSRFMESSEVQKFASLTPALSYCEIVFKDNGIGFNERYAEKLFQIFQRLHSTQQIPGTGIGLALCKKLVITHHGEIFARSIENVGTSFYIILPLTQVVPFKI